jgi:hypothetical protein
MIRNLHDRTRKFQAVFPAGDQARAKALLHSDRQFRKGQRAASASRFAERIAALFHGLHRHSRRGATVQRRRYREENGCE